MIAQNIPVRYVWNDPDETAPKHLTRVWIKTKDGFECEAVYEDRAGLTFYTPSINTVINKSDITGWRSPI